MRRLRSPVRCLPWLVFPGRPRRARHTSGTHTSGRVTVRVDFSGPAIGQVGHLGAGVLRFGGDTADDKSFAGTLAPGYSAALVKVPVG